MLWLQIVDGHYIISISFTSFFLASLYVQFWGKFYFHHFCKNRGDGTKDFFKMLTVSAYRCEKC